MLIYYFIFTKPCRIGEINYKTDDVLYAYQVNSLQQINDLSVDKANNVDSYDIVFRNLSREHADNENTSLFLTAITETYDFYQKYADLFRTMPLDNLDISPSYSESFTNSDLINGRIIIQHKLNTELIVSSVYNMDKQLITPTEFFIVDDDRVQIYFNQPIAGTYRVVLISASKGLLQ